MKPYKLPIIFLAVIFMLALAACNQSNSVDLPGSDADLSAPATENTAEERQAAEHSSGATASLPLESSTFYNNNETGEALEAESAASAGDFSASMPEVAAATSSAGNEVQSNPSNTPASATNERSDGMTSVNIIIGNETFTALFYDNEASRNLIEQMPLTVNMSDLNRNEKYYYFPDNLHSSSTKSPSTIVAGEIMCWSGNCLVLFYDTFPNAYGGYVRMGYIENTSGLASAVGSGNVDVTFSVA